MSFLYSELNWKKNIHPKSFDKYIIIFCVIIVAFIVWGINIYSSKWIGSTDFHSCIEMSSSIIAYLAAFSCIIYFFGHENRYYLVIGLGFILSGSESLIHGIFSYEKFNIVSNAKWQEIAANFLPATYIAGRFLLGGAIIGAAFFENMFSKIKNVKKATSLFLIAAFLLGIGITVLFFFLPLTDLVFPGNIISRPIDFISALLFCAAFIVIFKRFRKNVDLFSGMLLCSILFNFFGQLYMSFSGKLYDIYFDTAHWAGIVSYIFPVSGIVIETLNEIKKNRLVEKALLKERDHSGNIINGSPIIICSLSPDRIIKSVNEAACKITGYSEDELRDKDWSSIFSIKENDEDVFPDFDIAQYEINFTAKSGQLKIIEWNFIKHTDCNNNLQEIICFGNDVTETRSAELELQTRLMEIQEQDWLKTGLARLSDYMRGDQDTVTLCNNIITSLAEYLNAQIGALYITSENYSNVLELAASYAYTRRKRITNSFNFGEGLVGQAAYEKKEIVLEVVPDDYIVISSGLGETVPKNILVFPVLYNDAVCAVIELGWIKKFESNYLFFLKHAMENIGITLVSSRDRLKLLSLLQETREQSEKLQSQQEELRTSNEELEEQTILLKKSEEKLQTKQQELVLANKELELKTKRLENQKTEIIENNKELELIRIDLEKQARELEISSQYKSEFLANMSHELRTPLNSLLILSRDLADNKKNNLTSDQVESAEIIYNGGNDLLNLINEILDLSKIEAGKVVLNLEDMELSDLVTTLNRNFKHVAQNKGVSFNIELSQDFPKCIFTDQQRLEQILRNLISNAIKFTSEGQIDVKFYIPQIEEKFKNSELNSIPLIAISVTDTGVGIPAEKYNEIFEAFQQADGSTSRKYGGTGLGLSISRELCKLLGGEIRLVSKMGSGSSFTVFLPQTIERRMFDLPERRKLSVDYKTGSFNGLSDTNVKSDLTFTDDREQIKENDKVLLVIEDDFEFTKIIYDFCHEKNFKCLHSANGEKGIELAKKYVPDAVILDIFLPGMTGWNVLDLLKEDFSTRHIPVHVISIEDEADSSLKKGAIGFSRKPLTYDELNNVFFKINKFLSKEIKELLIVEDDEELVNSIIKLISGKDIGVDKALTGEEALKKLIEKNYDCLVLDLGLPDMDGSEVLKRSQKNDKITMPPVIIYTGKEINQEKELELRKYAHSIILKQGKSEERLLDETALLMHRIVKDMPARTKQIIDKLHAEEKIFQGKKILIVDDDMRNVFAITKILEEKGVDVLKAANGQKALEILKENKKINIILMDIMMPVMDGYTAISEIRKMNECKDVIIIALTAKAMRDDRKKCLKAGANDYLAKPIDSSKLMALLKTWLR